MGGVSKISPFKKYIIKGGSKAITTRFLVTLATSALDQESIAEVDIPLKVEETATTPAVIKSYTAPGVALEEPRVDMSRSKQSHEDAPTTLTPVVEDLI